MSETDAARPGESDEKEEGSRPGVKQESALRESAEAETPAGDSGKATKVPAVNKFYCQGTRERRHQRIAFMANSEGKPKRAAHEWCPLCDAINRLAAARPLPDFPAGAECRIYELDGACHCYEHHLTWHDPKANCPNAAPARPAAAGLTGIPGIEDPTIHSICAQIERMTIANATSEDIVRHVIREALGDRRFLIALGNADLDRVAEWDLDE